MKIQQGYTDAIARDLASYVASCSNRTNKNSAHAANQHGSSTWKMPAYHI
jgi:hypothetical protein